MPHNAHNKKCMYRKAGCAKPPGVPCACPKCSCDLIKDEECEHGITKLFCSAVHPSSTVERKGWEEEFDSMFNWADQIKDEELARWKVMYGFQPKDLKYFIRTHIEKVRQEERKHPRKSKFGG